MKPTHPLRILCSVILTCALLLATACRATDSGDIDAFVRSIYTRYALNGPGVSLSGADATPFITPSLQALVRRDEALLRGEAGVLDADPICACQDFDIQKLDRVVVKSNSAQSEATAVVSFHNLGRAQTIELKLLNTPVGWRIDDISYEGMLSIRRALLREISELGHGN